MTLTKRGDVVLVLFPNTDLRTAKRRPALVVQANGLGTDLTQTVLAMISSNIARAGHLSRISVLASSPEGVTAGLRLDSVIMTDNLITVLNNEIVSIIGALPNMTDVNAALRHTLFL